MLILVHCTRYVDDLTKGRLRVGNLDRRSRVGNLDRRSRPDSRVQPAAAIRRRPRGATRQQLPDPSVCA